MTGARVRVAVGVAALLLVLAVAGQRVGVRDLRRLEADYIAAREPTACATAKLTPFATGGRTLDELDAEVERLVVTAGEASSELQRRFDDRTVLPFPPLRSARTAVGEALDAQVALYEAMLATPAESADELAVLGRRNAAAERALGSARSALLTGPHEDWKDRFRCDRGTGTGR